MARTVKIDNWSRRIVWTEYYMTKSLICCNFYLEVSHIRFNEPTYVMQQWYQCASFVGQL